MKKILLVFALFIFGFSFSQKTENKVWDLLFSNKRTEARTLFDKNFASKKTSSFELLLLDALIEEEMGQFNFDETFLKNFLNLNENKNFLVPMAHNRFVVGDVADYGFDDLSYKKIDLLANSAAFNDENFVLSYKNVLDKNRKNFEGARKYADKLGNVNKWQKAGVFENLNGSGIDIEYEPETYAKNDKLFNANSLGMVGWYNSKWQNEGFEYLLNEQEYGEGIVYAQSFINNPVERRVLLEANMNSDFKVFLNDVEILSSTKDGYTSPGSHLVEVLLPKGINRLLLKVGVSKTDTAFMAVFFDKDYNKLKDLTYSDQYSSYNKSTLQELNPVEQPLRFERLLKEKIQQNPDKLFYKLLLANGYIVNSQNEQAREIAEELLVKYPNSTMFNSLLARYYGKLGETAKNAEVMKNIQVHDPEYFMIPLLKMQEDEWMENATIAEIDEQANILKKTKGEMFADLFHAMSAVKSRDIPNVIKYIKGFKEKTYNNETFFSIVAPLENVDQVDQTATIKSFENFLKNKINFNAMFVLANLYKSSNQTEESKKLYQEYIDVYPSLNIFRKGKVGLLTDNLKNPEIINQLDESEANFPYSFSVLSMKADLFAKQGKKDEALKYAALSLSHDSGNAELLKLQRDLNNKEDEIGQIATKDFTKMISERRNTKLKGSKGITTLLDEYIVNVFPEGGYKKRSTYLYEITAEQGIDEIKEYYVGQGKYILKAEISKKNGAVIPAEKSYGQIVFTNAEVGDVLLIQTEGIERTSGRFYKDFHLSSYFSSAYPVVESVFTVITPENMNYQKVSINGDIPSTTKKLNGKNYQTWRLTNLKELNLDEAYSSGFNDLSNSVTVNSIKSWKDIADWYSDLTKKSLVYDNTVDKAFKQIFPTGTSGMSDFEKAEKIYGYIEKNINYSSVDFRQSGYIPQKPSKTLVTRLGDCKDLSTLFVVMAKQAGLKSNLVLVQTNNLEDSNMSLPNLGFNHCIVQANLDGKIYYLEMTDKYLPFNSLVKNLYHAKALVINQDKALNASSEIFEIPDTNSFRNLLKTSTTADFTQNNNSFSTVQYLNGSGKSYYNDLFSGESTDLELKKNFEETYGNTLNNVVKVTSVKYLSGKGLSNEPISYEVKYNINDISQSLGNLQIIKIPFVTRPFTKDIISVENRNTDIKYVFYENQNEYDETIEFIIPENMTFFEVPKNEEFSYKNFRYSITYNLEASNKMKVNRKATTSWENISKNDYGDFKTFIEKILKVESQVLGYKAK